MLDLVVGKAYVVDGSAVLESCAELGTFAFVEERVFVPEERMRLEMRRLSCPVERLMARGEFFVARFLHMEWFEAGGENLAVIRWRPSAGMWAGPQLAEVACRESALVCLVPDFFGAGAGV